MQITRAGGTVVASGWLKRAGRKTRDLTTVFWGGLYVPDVLVV